MAFEDFPRGAGNHDAPQLLGTAAWQFTAPDWQRGAIWLGRDRDGRTVGHLDDRHVITVAGSRSGKGRSTLIPNLLLYSGSCVVNDPKGENATITAAYRARVSGHKVIVIDPKGVAKVPSNLRATFNPLDLINHEDDDAIDITAAIGEAVTIDSGDGKDVHWTESGRQLIEGLILHVATTEVGATRSLVRVRQLLTIGDPEYAEMLSAEEFARKGEKAKAVGPFEALWRSMTSSVAANPAIRDIIAGAAYSILDMGENERGSVLSTARRNTKFIDSRWMQSCLQGSGGNQLDIDALKTTPGGVSVYVCMPARFMATHARFLRLVFNLILYRMEAQGLDKPACGLPVLFVLDEIAALGRLEIIEKAAGLMAGYGVKLWSVWQDLGQLKRHYNECWETFLGNAGILSFFANSDMTTLEWLSKRMGDVELLRETDGASEAISTQTNKSQGRTETAGWSRSKGVSSGQSEMPVLSQVSARDGGSGLVPFMARAGASAVGANVTESMQEGQSGGESIQHSEGASSGKTQTTTRNQSLHKAALMNPDEISRLFDRMTGRQIVLLNNAPVALLRTNWDEDDAFAEARANLQSARDT